MEAYEKMIAAPLHPGVVPQRFQSEARARRASIIYELGVGSRVLIDFQHLAFQTLESWQWAVVAITNGVLSRLAFIESDRDFVAVDGIGVAMAETLVPLPIFNNQVFRIEHATLSETEDGVGKDLPIHVIGTIPLRTNDGGGLVLIIVIIATSTEAESHQYCHEQHST